MTILVLHQVVPPHFTTKLRPWFRELSKCTVDAEVERRLFKAAVASSAGRVCGWKRYGVASNGKNVTPRWNQELKDAIRAKKVAYKGWLHNKADSSLHSRYAEARNSAALTVKKFKMHS